MNPKVKVKGQSDILFHIELFNSIPELKEATFLHSLHRLMVAQRLIWRGSIPEASSIPLYQTIKWGILPVLKV